jgi:hypothetical protein
LRPAAHTAKAGRTQLGASMSGIIPIAVFLVVMAALNLFEFGRLD